MFQNIAAEDKAYLTVTNEHIGTYRHSPNRHLEQQACNWETRWHRASDLINKGIRNLLKTIVNLAKHDTEIDNAFNTEKYDNGLKHYAEDPKA